MSASEPQCHTLVGGQRLSNVHSSTDCAGQPCCIHNPTDHHMVEWPQNWRPDRQLVERVCPHGVGHPDPDGLVRQITLGRKWQGIHGCDGCCRP